jgi:hypothetical protein
VVAAAAILAALAGHVSRSSSHAPLIAADELLGAKAMRCAPRPLGIGRVEVQAVAQMDYENRAYPLDAIDYSQTLGAIAAGKRPRPRLEVAEALGAGRGGTVNVGGSVRRASCAPRGVSGRISAIAVDYKRCDAASCALFVGAAGGGVWRTDDALAPTPHWQEMNDRLDSLSIGSLLIDRLQREDGLRRLGEPNGASENEAGLGLYRSTNRGKDPATVSSATGTRTGPAGAVASVVALTGVTADEDTRRIRESGVQKILTKPVNVTQLLLVLKEMLESKPRLTRSGRPTR